MQSPNLFQNIHHNPCPPKPKISSLNDCQPFALTSVAMKVFEHLVLRYLKSATDSLLDPYQFAYRANRSVEEAVTMFSNTLTTPTAMLRYRS